ncbi:MAG: UvrD-helicase domain-containing protein [Bacteroidales bacterium]|nr:UvrD-helicase domain-containing protein [Bacteroidales bacterium]
MTPFLIICFLLIACGSIYAHIQATIKRSKQAQDEFNNFSNPGRFSSDDELTTFTNKFAKTEANLRRLHKYFSSLIPALSEPYDFFNQYRALHQQNNATYRAIIEIEEWASDFNTTLSTVYFAHHYFTHSEKENLLADNEEQINKLHQLFPRFQEYFTEPVVSTVHQILRHFDRLRKDHNKKFVKDELEIHKEFFDSVLAYPLDPQQREAIVKEEDNSLIVSGAGSGKTSTIIGKLHYLLDIKHVNPEQILCLSYTRDAAYQLRQRVNEEQIINCSTFHKLAIDIITSVEGRRPDICDNSLILTIFQELIDNNPEFKTHVYNYITRQQSLARLSHQYSTVQEYVVNRKKYGVMSPFPDCRGNLIFTKSEEEKRLCILLTELGIDFLYEEFYPYETQLLHHNNFRQYRPDFTLLIHEQQTDPVTGQTVTTTRKVYLEHFAIDSNGNVPGWFAETDPNRSWRNQNRKYHEGIEWKRQTHAHYKTTLIETTSADFYSGNIRETLIQKLRGANVPIHERTQEECYARLVQLERTQGAVAELLSQFITITKSNNINLETILSQATERGDRRTIYIIRNIVSPLFATYERELQRRRQIDFVDAINRAAEYCKSREYSPNYSHILVDEFQDISIDRYHFLQALRRHRPQTKLFCVGDDWQSIYRFGGSDINLFYRFEEFFGATERMNIQTTYRLRDPLLTLSSNFIMQNPEQTRREIIPHTPEPETEIRFIDCGASRNHRLIDHFQAICNEIPQNESVLILGRYNRDIRSINPQANLNAINLSVTVNGRNITYLSVHKSKGLEADNVILINCHSGVYGFPSLIEDDPILSYLLSEADRFENAEERRLFYVAITRAKKRMYILYYSDTPSPFLQELNSDIDAQDQRCPLCNDGSTIGLGYYRAANGNPYVKIGCTNNENGCPYIIRRFENRN